MPSEFHVDQALTNFAATESFNDEAAFIAPVICPVLQVKKKSDVFYKFRSDHTSIAVSDVRSGDGYANEIGWSYTTDNYSCKERSLKKWSSQNDLDNADDVVLVDQRDTLHVKRGLLLQHELRVQALAAATTNKYTPGTKWNATGTTYILNDVVAAKQSFRDGIGADPTHIVMDCKIADIIAVTAEIKDLIKYVIAAGSSPADSLIGITGSQGTLPKVFLGMTPVIAAGYYNAAARGQTRDMRRIWGTDAFLVRVDESPAVEVATWAKAFMFENFTMSQYQMPGKRGRYVEGYWTLDEKETQSSAILRIVSVLS